jgi:glycosyltransferase involved in cell wall biosynthesis
VSPGDVDGIIDAIEKLKADEGLRKLMGANGRKAFESKYSARIAAKRYYNLVSEL